MKILLVSTEDIKPGAARAAYRLKRSLQRVGVNSQMLVQLKQSDDNTVIGTKNSVGKIIAEGRKTLDKIPFILYPNREREQYGLQWLPDNITSHVRQLNPDIVSLHWVCDGYLKVETLAKLNKPLIWTLRDMWPFTGGCHYSGECSLYTQSCGNCPQIQSNSNWDVSRWVWHRKTKAWEKSNLTIVSLSNWLAECARKSSLFKDRRIEVIPNGIDTEVYKPIKKQVAREILKLPQDKKLVLFGAVNATSNKRKGFHLLLPALQELSQSQWQRKINLVIFGASEPENPIDFGFKTHYLGGLNDDISLALVYSAADVLVAPSIQENLANTVLESIACGTPSVAFNIGGMPDLIEHEQNGYLAQPFKINDLANGISWILESSERYQKLSNRSREKTEQQFTMEIQAKRYLSLADEILHFH